MSGHAIAVFNQLKIYKAQNIISIGSGYIPTILIEQYSVKINIHPGILPNYKGIGSPEAIMKGDFSQLGWSIHELTPKIDSGRIIHNHRILYKIFENMTFAEIYVSIYISAIIHFLSVLSNPIKSEIGFNSTPKLNSFVKFTQFIRYKYSSIDWRKK